jgi:NADH-quinone oxidoreductase subunit L
MNDKNRPYKLREKVEKEAGYRSMIRLELADELYDKIIVKPLNKLGQFLNEVFEKQVVDGIVNGVGRAVNYGSRQLRLLQSGQVGSYVLLMVLGMLVIFVIQFFLRK